MALQAYFDDSSTEDGVHVLAGYMARAESWGNFSNDWEKLLHLTYQDRKTGVLRFKMQEIIRRHNDLPLFYDVIGKHVSLAISIMINSKDLRNAKARIWSDCAELHWSPHENIGSLMVRFLCGNIFQACWGDDRIHELFKDGDPIDIYLDRDFAPEYSLEDWDTIIDKLPEDIQRNCWRAPTIRK